VPLLRRGGISEYLFVYRGEIYERLFFYITKTSFAAACIRRDLRVE
jgi:hypothetical protein